MEGLYIFHGTAAHILWRNYTFSTETLPIFYRTVIHFVRKSCIFSTENPVHIRFYGSVMHLLRNSYTFSKEALHIFYGTRVSLTGHRSIQLKVKPNCTQTLFIKGCFHCFLKRLVWSLRSTDGLKITNV